MKRCAGLLMAALLWAGVSQAELKVAGILGDHMVLQRQASVPIWGTANPGDAVTVEFAGQKKTATSDKAGQWKVQLDSMKASSMGRALVVSNKTTRITLDDVLVGEVWLCAGQSNMDYEFAGGRRGERNLLAAFDAEANYPTIRHFAVAEKSAIAPQSNPAKPASWQLCSPKSVAEFSAVGYFFGRMVHKETGVPVGLITSAVGGTKIDAWARAQELEEVPGCEFRVGAVLERAKDVAAGTFTMEGAMDRWTAKYDPGLPWKPPSYDASGWKTMPVPTRWGSAENKALATFKGLVWFRRTVNLPTDFADKDLIVSLAAIDDRDATFFNGERVGSGMSFNIPRRYTVPAKLIKAGPNVIAVRVWNGWGDGGIWGEAKEVSVYPKGQPEEAITLAGDWRYKESLPAGQSWPAPVRMGIKSRENMATGLYNGMIAPVVPYAIRGAIWYQGESNGNEGRSYMLKTRALVEGWRNAWGQGEFPFYYVQLANFQAPGESAEGGDGWAKIRMAQLKALDIKNTGMAVVIELADAENPKDVHPQNKKDVGERLALWALAKEYGKKIEYSGPLYKSMTVKGSDAIIHFDHVGSGLMVATKVGIEPAKEVADGTLKEVSISGADGQWHLASAKIVGDTVVVSSKEVAKPVAVRYAYTMNPAGANLYNKAGLPASPFTSDDHWHNP